MRALERRAADGAADSVAEGEEGWFVRLTNGDVLAVSRRQLPVVRAVLARADGAAAPGPG